MTLRLFREIRCGRRNAVRAGGVVPFVSTKSIYRSDDLDRAAERRDDAAWIAGAWAHARVVPVHRGRHLVAGEPPVALFPPARGPLPDDAVFLGVRADGTPYFSVVVDAKRDDEAAIAATGATDPHARFADLRRVEFAMDASDVGLMMYARALAHWHERTRFCSVCGAPTRALSAGHVLACINEADGTRFFPRSDPATIMLVTDGSRALLGRQREWPEGMYSTLAGFCEPGESLEDCVAREVYEEAGIRIEEIRYFASQPWPFPQSLMVGYFARATTFDVRIGDEMDDVRWFKRDEVAALSVRLETRLPALDTIARRLIRAWLAATA